MTARPSDRRRCVVVATWYPTPEGPVDGIFVREAARAVARHDAFGLDAIGARWGTILRELVEAER
jgi:hypothetical protein